MELTAFRRSSSLSLAKRIREAEMKLAHVFLSIFFFVLAGTLFALASHLEKISDTALKIGMIGACAATVLAFYTWWKMPARVGKNHSLLVRHLFKIWWYVSLSMAMALGYVAGWYCGEKDSPHWGVPIAMGVIFLGALAKTVLLLKRNKIERDCTNRKINPNYTNG